MSVEKEKLDKAKPAEFAPDMIFEQVLNPNPNPQPQPEPSPKP